MTRIQSGNMNLQPNDLFALLRSPFTPVEQKLDLVKRALTDRSWPLKHKEQYILQWMLESDLHKSNSRPDCLMNQVDFWVILRQLLTFTQPSDGLACVPASSIQAFIQLSTRNWSSLLHTDAVRQNICSCISVLFRTSSHRFSFETIMDLLLSTLDSAASLGHCSGMIVEEMILLISDGVANVIRQTSNHRKASIIILEDGFLSTILRCMSNFGISSQLGSSLTRLIVDCIFSVDRVKRLLSTNPVAHGAHRDLEWLFSLRPLIIKHHELVLIAIQLLPSLLLRLIELQPALQAQVFPPHKGASPPSRNTSQDPNLTSAQDLVFYFVSSSHHFLRDFTSSSDIATSKEAMLSVEKMVKQLLAQNVYTLSNRYQYDILDEITGHCVDCLTDLPHSVAAKSMATLTVILALDCRMIENRLIMITSFMAPIPPEESSLAHEIESFLTSLVAWFSKAKRLPQLLDLMHEGLERNLTRFPLPVLMSGPLTSEPLFRLLREEIRSSMSATQLDSALDKISQRLVLTFRSTFPRPPVDADDNRRLKKLKQTSILADDPRYSTCETAASSHLPLTESEIARCVLNTQSYILFITASSRLPLSNPDRLGFYERLDSVFDELDHLLGQLRPDSRSHTTSKRQRSSLGPCDQLVTQGVAASAFEVLNAIIKIRGQHPGLRETTLTPWLKALRRAVDGKYQLKSPLTIQIVQSALLTFKSQKLTCGWLKDSISLTYDIILNILDACPEVDMDDKWNGKYYPISSVHLPCATWYVFSTMHLSSFSDHATVSQLHRLARIILQCGPSYSVSPAYQDDANEDNAQSISYRQVNSTLLSSPSFHELTNMGKSILKEAINLMDQNLASQDYSDTGISAPKTFINSSAQMIGLFANLANLPTDCLPKTTRIALLQKSLAWALYSIHQNDGLCKEHSTGAQRPSNISVNSIYSIRYIITLLRNTESITDQSPRGSVLELVRHILSDRINWLASPERETLHEIAEVFLREAVWFIFRCNGGLNSHPAQEWINLGRLLFPLMARIEQTPGGKVPQARSDKLVVLALEYMVEAMQPLAQRHGNSLHNNNDLWLDYVKTVMQHTVQIAERVANTPTSSPNAELVICKIHFRLAWVVSRMGVQVRRIALPASDFLTRTSDSQCNFANDHEKTTPQSSILEKRKLALNVVAEWVNARRGLTKPSPCDITLITKPFQCLAVLYVSSLIAVPAHASTQVIDLKNDFRVACSMISAEEYEDTLDMLVEEMDRLLSKGQISAASQSATVLQVLTEMSSAMLLNGPQGVGKKCRSYIQAFIRRLHHPTMHALRTSAALLWQCKFLEAICTAKIHSIGNTDVALILEIFLEKLAVDSRREQSPISSLSKTESESPCENVAQRVYQSIIVTISQLCRHQRQALLPVFQILISVILELLRPLHRPTYLVKVEHPQAASDNRRVPSKIVRQAQGRFPSWSWIDATTEAAWDQQCCGLEEVAAYCRLLVELGVKTSSVGRRSRGKDSYAESISAKVLPTFQDRLTPLVVSLNPALSKHAPFYLRRYVKMCTDMNVKIPHHFHRCLIPGIAVLINSMGNHERTSIGRMVSQSSAAQAHLSEAPTVIEEEGDEEAQKELWRKLLGAWELKRYKGVD